MPSSCAPAPDPTVEREPAMSVKKIRLLKFLTDFSIGGTERQALNLTKAMANGRFELHMACFRRSGDFLHEIEERDLPLTEYRIRSFYHHSTVQKQLQLARYIGRHRIQVVHTYGLYANIFAVPAARLAGAPVIVASIRETGDLWTPWQSRVQRLVCRFATRIVVNAAAISRRLVTQGYPRDKITVIKNGLDLSRFAGTGQGPDLRQELGLSPRAPLVGVLGRINRMKGLEDFLSAAKIVARRFPDARFLIVGEGCTVGNGSAGLQDAYMQELKRLAARLGLDDRVVFTGFRLDTPRLLTELSVSVLPSLSEGLSNVLLESMAAGVPIVATDVGGNPEVVEEGVTGLLVPPRNHAALAQAVGELLEDPERAARFGRAGKHRVNQHFSLDRMVQETERLYLELLYQSWHRGMEESREPMGSPPPVSRKPSLAPPGASDKLLSSGDTMITALHPVTQSLAEPGDATLSVEPVTEYEAFLGLQPVWNRLVEEAGIYHPFLTHEWMRNWWDSFGTGHELHILLVKAGREVIAIAPLMRSHGRLYGLKVRLLQSVANVYAERYDFILTRQPKEAFRAIWEYLAAQKGAWDVLELCQLPVGSYALETLPMLAAGDGYLTGLWPSNSSPYVPIRGSWDHYLDGLDRKHRSNLRNRSKRLSELGPVALEVVTTSDRLDDALEEGFRLEAAAWKGGAGTAISSQPVLRSFYAQFARRAANRGWLRLNFLTVNGRRIAFQYAICFQNKLYLLKPGYDPAYAHYSPSNLLCGLVLREAYAQGLEEFDFLGASEPWKLEWSRDARSNFWLFVFPQRPLPRALHWLKFTLIPTLKAATTWLSRLRQAVRGTAPRVSVVKDHVPSAPRPAATGGSPPGNGSSAGA